MPKDVVFRVRLGGATYRCRTSENSLRVHDVTNLEYDGLAFDVALKGRTVVFKGLAPSRTFRKTSRKIQVAGRTLPGESNSKLLSL